jgi:hypothetical protein
MGIDALIAQIVDEASKWIEVIALVQSGSRTAGNADAISDLDLYLYVSQEVPLERRRALINGLSDVAEIDNHFWETSDEWIDRLTGVSVDMMYRSPEWIEKEIACVMDLHQASIGYTTCLLHNVLTSKPLIDRSGWFAQLQRRAARPYPEELAHAIVKKNHPLLRDARGAFGGQILRAARRADIVSVHHRTAAFLASYFDVLFALNRAPHPGEKRLVALATRLPQVPTTLAEDVSSLVVSGIHCNDEELRSAIDKLVVDLDSLLSKSDLT